MITFTADLKKVTSIGFVLLSLLFVLQSGHAILLLIQQEMLRNEIKQKYLEGFIGHELLILEIPFHLEMIPNQQFKRIHDKEFVYNGQMYDIVEEEQIGSSTWYLVYPDRKETKLKSKLRQQMADYDQQKGKFPAEKWKSLSVLMFFNDLTKFSTNFLNDSPAVNKAIYIFVIKECSLEPHIQPPCWG